MRIKCRIELSSELGVFHLLILKLERGRQQSVFNPAAQGMLIIENAQVSRGFLENSNVDLTEQFTEMIKAQRAYQVSSRLVSISDEMEGIANNLRK